MKRRSFFLVLILSLGLIAVLWLTMREGQVGSTQVTSPRESIQERGRVNLDPSSEGKDNVRSPLAGEDESHTDPVRRSTASESADEHVTFTPPKPDLEARDVLAIRVIDQQSRPVPDATAVIRGMRSESDRGSWYRYRGEQPHAVTDIEGRAQLSHWTWVNIDGRTESVDLTITHADFPDLRDDSFKVGSGEHVIVLKRGATLVVSGRIAPQGEIVRDISVRLDGQSRLPEEAWHREPDGRLSTNRLAPGQHRLYLEHSSPEHGPRYSALVHFELVEGERKELDLDLLAAARLEGVLDPLVPRPIVDGHVLLSVQAGGHAHDDPAIYRRFEAVVHDDGSFVIDDLPHGRGQIISLCRGWVSRRTLADSAQDVGVHFSEPPTPEEEQKAILGMDDRAFQAQRVNLPQTTNPLVVLMEQTAALDILVKTDSGATLPGAEARASPNVSFTGVGSSIFPWGTWSALTDGTGHARIEGIPPDPMLWVYAQHDSYQMLRHFRQRPQSVALRSGEVSTVEITLEPKPR